MAERTNAPSEGAPRPSTSTQAPSAEASFDALLRRVDAYDQRARARAISLLGLVAASAALSVLVIATLVRGTLPPVWVIVLPFALTMLSLPLLLRYGGSPARALQLVMAILLAYLPALLAFTGGTGSPVMAVLPVAPVLLSQLVPMRAAFMFGCALFAEMLIMWWLTTSKVLPPPGLSQAKLETLRVVLIGTGILSSLVNAYFIRRQRDEFERLLKAQASVLYEASTRDALTGLYNRRYFDERLEAEIAYAARHRTDVGVALIDVDRFKQINDKFGHATGDQVLVSVGRCIRNSLRAEDVVARYGGEEFVILLRGETMTGTRLAAERVRRAVEAQVAGSLALSMPVTISVGCAAAGADAGPGAILMAEADRRLYTAKEAGRNRVAAPAAAVGDREARADRASARPPA